MGNSVYRCTIVWFIVFETDIKTRIPEKKKKKKGSLVLFKKYSRGMGEVHWKRRMLVKVVMANQWEN